MKSRQILNVPIGKEHQKFYFFWRSYLVFPPPDHDPSMHAWPFWSIRLPRSQPPSSLLLPLRCHFPRDANVCMTEWNGQHQRAHLYHLRLSPFDLKFKCLLRKDFFIGQRAGYDDRPRFWRNSNQSTALTQNGCQRALFDFSGPLVAVWWLFLAKFEHFWKNWFLMLPPCVWPSRMTL